MNARLTALVLLGACQVAVRSTASPQCTANSDCVSTKICFYGACVTAATSSLTSTWVEIAQSSSSALNQQRSVENSARNDLAIAQTRIWSGTIGTSGNYKNGYILLQRVSSIPSRQITSQALARVNGTFSAALEPGLYHPIFFPDDTTLPPLPLSDWNVINSNPQVTVTYPDVSTLATISGRVGPSAANPTQGISVRVFAVQDGTQLTSTTTQTGSDGSFTLLMSPSVVAPAAPVSLVIGPSATNTFVPRRTEAGVVVTAHTHLDDIYLEGIANTARVSGTVTGIDATGAIASLAGVAVLATTSIGGGTFTAGALSDASGVFKIDLTSSTDPQPLSYEVNFVPPPSSLYGRTTVRYDLQSTGTPAPITIKLGARFVLSGTVLDAKGTAVTNAQIAATPTNPSVLAASTLHATSGADGRFALRVDPNDYVLSVTPAPGSTDPAGGGSATVTSSNVDTTIRLPPGVFVSGEVSAPKGVEVSGTGLSFYHDANDGTPAVLIGTSVVDANHHYSVVLPAQ